VLEDTSCVRRSMVSVSVSVSVSVEVVFIGRVLLVLGFIF
jgi:hypothetical protein